MKIRNEYSAVVTVLLTLQAAGLALGFETVQPDTTSESCTCTQAMVLPTGHDNLVDINSAPREWLVSIGMEEPVAVKIISDRPYQATGDLLTRGIVPPATYDKVKDRIIARRA